MGAGWDQTFATEAPANVRFAAAVGVRVGWEETNRSIPVQVTIEDDDARELMRVDGAVQVGRAPDLPPGTSQLAQFAINLVLPLPAFGGYRMRVVAGTGDEPAMAARPFRLVKR
ncbi:MAG: hypothetical protein C0506_02700 [Anaerolinea sp.]|nr:hypothetical protein [Anaerolinea sp.]